MAWTEFTRNRYERKSARYSSDVTDREWAIILPLLPGPNLLGRPRKVTLGDVWDGIQYVAASGCAWSLLPKDFPPVSTARYYFHGWRNNGLLVEVNRALVALARETEGRNRQPTAGVIDSQSVKTTENGGICGYDAGKRIRGRKRHIMTDTCGHLVALRVHSAGIQDRDGAPEVLRQLAREAPKLRHVFADGGYGGAKLRDALTSIGRWVIQIVKRSDTAEGFEVLPRRWVVERTFAWLGKMPPIGKGLGENHCECRGLGPHRTHQAHDKVARKRLNSISSF